MNTKYRKSAAKKRKSHQCKKAKLGHKSMRGQPELYDEMKQRYCLSLTSTVVAIIDRFAEQSDLSRSEYVEQFFRKLDQESGGVIICGEVAPIKVEVLPHKDSEYA